MPKKSHLDAVLIPIERAIVKSKIDINGPDALQLATKANVDYIADQLVENSKTIADAVKNGKLKLIKANYDLASGKVGEVQ